MKASPLKTNVVIALDAMGGDNAPDIVVAGAALTCQDHGDISFIFFGDKARIAPLLDKHPQLKPISRIEHTDKIIANDEKPSAALRAGRDSSMGLAIASVAAGEADCVISAGNTGALMAMSMMGLKRLPGISRPAIASFVPNPQGGRTVMLDLGANLVCTPENLVEFALLGSVFAREVMSIDRPRVGLLNVGAEQGKGSETVKAAATRLTEMNFPGRFSGFVEGDDILKGTVDVIVTDGWTGNVALKTMEGTASFIGNALKESLWSSWLAKFGLLFVMPALRKLKHKIDPRRYNGGPFMGLRGVSIKSHGGTDGYGYKQAICVGIDMVRQGFNDKVVSEIHALGLDDKPGAEEGSTS